MNKLKIGRIESDGDFMLPIDASIERFAFIGISGAGKTSAATVLAEEFCKNRQPWIAYDPTGVWWGLKHGTKSHAGYPVVVIGGQHGDLPLDKNKGAQIAEALISENVFAVIDVKAESKTTWRKFLTEFSLRLLDFSPDVPRHIFIEEASDFAPQRTRVRVTAECKEAIERLVRTGRNNGYGSSLINQRPATVDKDILSQVGNLFVLRTIGKHDRKALYEWMESNWQDVASAKSFLDKLPKLDDGHGWFWSPQWLKQFLPFEIRRRETFHPGETRRSSGTNVPGEIADATEFIERLKRQLGKKTFAVSDHGGEIKKHEIDKSSHEFDMLRTEKERLFNQLNEERDLRRKAEERLTAVKALLSPQWEQMQKIFAEVSVNGNVAQSDAGDYEIWLQKFRGSKKKILEIFIQRGRLNKKQAQILTGLGKDSIRIYFDELRRASLIRQDGDDFILQKP